MQKKMVAFWRYQWLRALIPAERNRSLNLIDVNADSIDCSHAEPSAA